MTKAVLAFCVVISVGSAAPRERRFILEYDVTTPATEKGPVHLWVPIPHDDANQRISRLRIESSAPYQIETDSLGNRILSVESTTPSVTLRLECVRQERVQPLQKSQHPAILTAQERAMWLAPDHLVPVDATIRRWAQEVVDDAHAHTDLEMARAIYNHVVATVKYDKTGKGWGRGDIYYACDARRGNCTDFHAIFIGYARAMGIPARFSIGIPLPAERGAGAIEGYHCWAEFYAEGIGWVPVDASEAAKNPSRREYYFGTHDENRIEFTQGRDLVLAPRQAGEPLNYFINPYAEAGGKPLEGVRKIVRWKDLSETTQGASSKGR
jgi:transglutaminase-like putative cysteine protease